MKTELPLLAVALAVAIAGCSKQPENMAPPADRAAILTETVDYAEMDRMAEEEIKAPNSAEARAWLRMPANAIFEGSKADVVALTESFYRAGCPKVCITGIEKLGDVFVSASMVVVLPSDPAKRTAAFQAEKVFAENQGEAGTPDKGQKYLELSFD